jgi:hypothetical protein
LTEVAKPTEEEKQHRKRQFIVFLIYLTVGGLFLLAVLYVAFILFAFFVLGID